MATNGEEFTYIDYLDPKLRAKIKNLKPIPGTCIFIDIIGSTMAKKALPVNWILWIGNTLKHVANTHSIFNRNIIKVIGDEIMIFVPDSDLGDENYGTIFDQLKSIVHRGRRPGRNLTLERKAAIHYCTDVYNINFLFRWRDFYGRGIDMTSRMISKAKGGQILLSEAFYKRVAPENLKFLDKVSERQIKKIKDIVVEFRTLDTK